MHILEKTEHEDAKRIDLFYQDTKAWKHFLRQFYVNFHPQKKRTLKFQRSSGGDDGIAKALYPCLLYTSERNSSDKQLHAGYTKWKQHA